MPSVRRDRDRPGRNPVDSPPPAFPPPSTRASRRLPEPPRQESGGGNRVASPSHAPRRATGGRSGETGQGELTRRCPGMGAVVPGACGPGGNQAPPGPVVADSTTVSSWRTAPSSASSAGRWTVGLGRSSASTSLRRTWTRSWRCTATPPSHGPGTRRRGAAGSGRSPRWRAPRRRPPSPRPGGGRGSGMMAGWPTEDAGPAWDGPWRRTGLVGLVGWPAGLGRRWPDVALGRRMGRAPIGSAARGGREPTGGAPWWQESRRPAGGAGPGVIFTGRRR